MKARRRAKEQAGESHRIAHGEGVIGVGGRDHIGNVVARTVGNGIGAGRYTVSIMPSWSRLAVLARFGHVCGCH